MKELVAEDGRRFAVERCLKRNAECRCDGFYGKKPCTRPCRDWIVFLGEERT